MNLQIDSKSKQDNFAEIDITALLKVLLTRKWIILTTMLIGLICGSLHVIRSPLVYQPFALIQITQSSNMASSMNLFGGMGAGLSQQASQADIEMTLMNSPYILEPVIHKLGLNISVTPKHFPIIGGLLSKLGWTDYPRAGETLKVALFNSPLDEHTQKYALIPKNATSYQLFSPDDQLILTGRVGQLETSPDGTVSILVSELKARTGVVFYVSNASMTGLTQSLGQSIKMTEMAPPNDQTGMAETGIIRLSMTTSTPYMAKNIIDNIIDFTVTASGKAQSAQDQKLLDFIQTQLPITQNKLNAAEIALNQYQAKTGIASLTSQSGMLLKQMSSIDSKISANDMNQAQLLQIYTRKNPIIQNIDMENRTLEAQKAKLQTALAALPLKDQEIVDLMRNVKSQQVIYSLLISKYQQTILMKAATTSDLHVLTYTQIPDEPMPGRAPVILLGSVLVGFIIGSLIVLALYFLNGGITDPYWTEKELGIRTLAIIPFSKSQAKAKKAFDKKQTSAIPILAKNDPDDICIESIRSLRTNLLLAMKEHKTNVVAVGGIVPQTGKSFISVNLAVILSESGKRVLLIDADMRRGYLNQYFKLAHSPGLSEALENVYPLEKIIRRTSIENLDFMSTGIFPRNPSELLLGERFGEIMRIVAAQYDVVVIDAPPILAVNDASVIAQQAGINYIVIPGGQLKSHEIESAVRRFYNDGVKINGSLFNFAKKMHEKTSSYGQSYGRYAQYYQRKQ